MKKQNIDYDLLDSDEDILIKFTKELISNKEYKEMLHMFDIINRSLLYYLELIPKEDILTVLTLEDFNQYSLDSFDELYFLLKYTDKEDQESEIVHKLVRELTNNISINRLHFVPYESLIDIKRYIKSETITLLMEISNDFLCTLESYIKGLEVDPHGPIF